MGHPLTQVVLTRTPKPTRETARVNLKQLPRLTPALLAILLIIGLRLIALRSDPFPRLDFSAALMTDEGFNIHNARNLVLFGHLQTDEYNNMLFSPLYHFGQVAVFSLFGVGSVQARLISVVCSLLTLALLWAALRRAFDNRIALTAIIFLGLDHTNLLYNRMALMDTPAAMFAVMAFYAFVRSMTGERRLISQKQRWLWLMACGALIASTVTVRTVGIYLVPVPFIALGLQIFRHEEESSSRRLERQLILKDILVLVLGILVVFGLYFLLWYRPHYAELASLSSYYKRRQAPTSLGNLALNVYHGILGDKRALTEYLIRHSPVLFTLALLGLVSRPKTSTPSIQMYLVAWLVLGWGLLVTTSYSPSRYYVTTYPAMAALAAVTVWQLPEIWMRLHQVNIKARLLRGALTWFLVYHAGLLFLNHFGIRSRSWAPVLIYGLPSAFVILDLCFSILDWVAVRLRSRIRYPRTATAAGFALWLIFNGYWLGGWLLGLDYTQYQMSQWLARNLPAGSVLIGDVAPGVCLDNGFIVVYVEPKLWNDVRPVESMGARYPNAPRYIVMDDRWKESFWMVHYPELVTPERRIKLAQVINWQVGVYPVEP